MKKLHIALIVALSLLCGSFAPMAFAVEGEVVYEYKYEDIMALLDGSASKSVSITRGIVLGQEIGKANLQGIYKAMGIPNDGIVNGDIKVAVYKHKDVEFNFYFDSNEILAGIWAREAKVREVVLDEVGIFAGLVTDTGGIHDSSFNQSAWDGIDRFALDKNIDQYSTAYIESDSFDALLRNLITFVYEDADIIIAPGFLMNEPVGKVAEIYPEQKILVLDTVVESPNVVSAVFAEEEGSFLVGVAAGLKAKEMNSKKVGFVGGMDFPLIRKFEAGFEAGVKAVNPSAEIFVSYSDSFSDFQLGREIGSEMYDQGVSVIYHAAGAVGYGLIDIAKERSLSGDKVYVIGVDVDSYKYGIYQGGESVILTSMVKNIDKAVYSVLEEVKSNSFRGGIQVFGLSKNGVGLPEENPNLSDKNLKIIDNYKAKVVSGDIVVPTEPERMR